MKTMTGLILGLFVHVLFAVHGHALQSSAAESNGVMVFSKNFDFTKKQFGIAAEYQQYYSQVKFQQMLTQELMTEGYTVVDRMQIMKVLGDIAIDLSGTVRGNDRVVGKPEVAVARADEDRIKKELSKDDLKKVGQALGLSYMIYFNMDLQYANMRIVHLDTSEIVATATFNVADSALDTVLNRVVAKSFVKALAAATTVKRPVKLVYCNYYDVPGGAERVLEEIKRSEVLLNEAGDKYGFVLYDKNER